MKVLSLFSGVGGFDMGLERAGMETVFQCEWDKHCRTILDRHWPTVPKWDDVSTLTGAHILTHAPVIDVVAWGSPCQDLSVAGRRAGLEGARSGLFHQGIRIIKELQELSNGQYPRISIWENVAGALSSNNGADFGQILYEMDEARACFSEWRLLDAQYFGIPQRRRRVFVISVFDPAIAERCPETLLPVTESLRRDFASSATTREETATEVAGCLRSGGEGDIPSSRGEHLVTEWWDGTQIADTITATSNEQRMPDKNRLQVVVESEIVGSLAARDYKDVGNQYVAENKLVVEPFTGSSYAQYQEGVGTLRANGGDLGGGSETVVVGSLLGRVPGTNHEGVRDGQLIVEPILVDGRRTNDVRVYESPVQTLEARMGTGGNNVPVIGFSHTQGLSAQPSEMAWPTLRKEGNGHAVAIPIQDGREIDKHQNGLGVAEEGSPAYTLDQTGAQAVAYGIQGNMIGRQDHNGPAGKGHTDEGDPMFTLTNTDIHAVAYDEYNDTVGDDIHHSLRAGTKQSTGIIEPTMIVRRLTPLECERLMGWPDHHTRYKADGTKQTDGHRYKQCGNGVASPVAHWIAEQILEITQGDTWTNTQHH